MRGRQNSPSLRIGEEAGLPARSRDGTRRRRGGRPSPARGDGAAAPGVWPPTPMARQHRRVDSAHQHAARRVDLASEAAVHVAASLASRLLAPRARTCDEAKEGRCPSTCLRTRSGERRVNRRQRRRACTLSGRRHARASRGDDRSEPTSRPSTLPRSSHRRRATASSTPSSCSNATQLVRRHRATLALEAPRRTRRQRRRGTPGRPRTGSAWPRRGARSAAVTCAGNSPAR